MMLTRVPPTKLGVRENGRKGCKNISLNQLVCNIQDYFHRNFKVQPKTSVNSCLFKSDTVYNDNMHGKIPPTLSF